MLFKKLVLLIFIFLIGCTDSDSVSGDVNNIKLEFIEGLNDDIDFHLNKNSEGYYELVLNKFSNQTIQRITAKLTQNNFPIQDNYGNIQPKLIEWESNLYWWLKKGDTVAQITKTYFNKFTGEITYPEFNIPELGNWRYHLILTKDNAKDFEIRSGISNEPLFFPNSDEITVAVYTESWEFVTDFTSPLLS